MMYSLGDRSLASRELSARGRRPWPGWVGQWALETRALGGHVVVALMSSWCRTGAGGLGIKFEGVKAGLSGWLGAWESRVRLEGCFVTLYVLPTYTFRG